MNLRPPKSLEGFAWVCKGLSLTEEEKKIVSQKHQIIQE